MAALTFKLEGNVQEIMEALDKLERKTSTTAKKIEADTRKMNKQFKDSNANLMLAGAGAVAFFWGLAQLSPVLSAYMGEVQASLGAVFDILFMSMMPLFEPLMTTLWDFAKWLQEAPEWVKQVGAVITLLIPTIWAFNAACAANPIGAVIVLAAALAAGLYLLWENWDMVTAATENATDKHEGLVLVLKAIKFYLDMWILQWKITYEAVKFYLEGVVFALDAVWWVLEPLVKFVSKIWDTFFKPPFDLIVGGIQVLIGWIQEWWDKGKGVANFFTGIYDTFFKPGIESLKWGLGMIVDALQWVWDMIKKVADFFAVAFKPIVDTLGAVGGALGDIGGAIGGAIPGFAEGGVVTKPTLAMIGEAGPEAVIPLSSGSVPIVGGSSSTSISISIDSPTFNDKNDIDYLVEEISRRLQFATDRSV